MAPNKMYDQIPMDRFHILRGRYDVFLTHINDENKEVIKIFDKLGPKQQGELQLIREVTKELQAKKEEDMRKAAQAAEEASKAEAESETKEESKEETGEEAGEKEGEKESTNKVEN